MSSAMKKPGRDLTSGNHSRTNDTLSDSEAQLEHRFQKCGLSDILEKDDLCNGTSSNQDGISSPNQQKFRVLACEDATDCTADREPKSTAKSPRPKATNSKRPLLQKKSHSDLGNYKEVHMKILVEGREVLDTCLQAKYCPRGQVSESAQQEATANGGHVTESLQRMQGDTKKPAKFFAGWFSKKAQSKTQEDRTQEPPIGFRSLRRSRSFSGRIKDKIKNINPGNHTVGSQTSRHLQPPIFYKIIDLKNVNREDHAFCPSYQRRHSDQTDSMLRRPLGGIPGTKHDIKSNAFSSLSLERGIKQHTSSGKKLLERKNSNSLGNTLEFPFWSQITDANRSRSCSARIRVSETRRDTHGMLETNLCSTEL